MKKVLVSGIQATGNVHIGNYFGAMKQNVELSQDKNFESYIFIADYHALTTVRDSKELKNNSLEAATIYLALGFDFKNANLFLQSQVNEVTELSSIFNNLVTMPYMMRAHAFKDHEAKSKEVNVGLFTYPILMAADILTYGGEVVPVGADQKQHIEYARDIAGNFNRAYGEFFKLPKDMIVEGVALVPGIDGQKMSKSKNNNIPLFCTDTEAKKIIMSIVTDSAKPEDRKNPDENNIYKIHKLFLDQDQDKILRDKFLNGGYGYKDAKQDLLDTFLNWRKPFVEKYNYYKDNPKVVETILIEGGEVARKKAKATLHHVRDMVGLINL
jgi:tryptophanyl-tRNA synthetase